MLSFVLAVVLCYPDELSTDAVEKNEEALDAMEAFEAEIFVNIILIAAQHLLPVKRHQVVESHNRLPLLRVLVPLLLALAQENVANFFKPLINLFSILINWRLERELLPEDV